MLRDANEEVTVLRSRMEELQRQRVAIQEWYTHLAELSHFGKKK